MEERKRSKPANGVRKGINRRVVISLDDETFDQVMTIAGKRRASFASVTRELIEFGLLDVEQDRNAA